MPDYKLWRVGSDLPQRAQVVEMESADTLNSDKASAWLPTNTLWKKFMNKRKGSRRRNQRQIEFRCKPAHA